MLRFIGPVLILFSVAVKADITIVDVRKNIPLSDADPSFTDFYLSAGSTDGLKKNLVVTVFRSTNVRDASGAQSFGEIAIPVGQVKVIAVYDKVSVAREYKLLPRDVNPMLEQIGLMSGDKIELSNSFVDNVVPKRKPQAVAEVISTPAPQPTPQALPVVVVPVPLLEKQVSNKNVVPATSPLPQAAPKPVATKMTATEDTSSTILPGEVTKTAEENVSEDSDRNSIPAVLIEDAPVNNTATEEAR